MTSVFRGNCEINHRFYKLCSVELNQLSECPDSTLDMNKVWNLFESYYPSGQFKTQFAKANEEKVKILQQDTAVGMNMTCHKMLEKSSFVVKKKKKGGNSQNEKPSSSKGQTKQLKITDLAQKKNVPKASAGQAEVSELSESSQSELSSDENLDEKLKNFIQAGFFM